MEMSGQEAWERMGAPEVSEADEVATTLGTFRLTIYLGNTAMWTPDDLADALEAVAVRVRERSSYPALIRDANGNTVGRWAVEPL